MKLSVIVPVYNQAAFVGATLESLLRQRHDVDLDIIVIDDGSTDESAEVVRRLTSETGCIRLQSQPNRGLAAARNAGLRALLPETELVSFLDSDDISPAGRFHSDLAHFAADALLDFTYSLVALVDRIDERLEPAEGASVVVARRVQMGAIILRRQLAQELGFDEDFEQAEDVDFLFRLYERKVRYKLLDSIGVYYRQHAGSMSRRREVFLRNYLRAHHKAVKRRRSAGQEGAMSDPLPGITMPESTK